MVEDLRYRKFLILCVDDEPSNLLIRQLVLRNEGYEVLVASDAETATDLFNSRPIDLVVTDHLLTRGTGAQLAAELKALKPSVPIAIISGHSGPIPGAEIADAVILKGFRRWTFWLW